MKWFRTPAVESKLVQFPVFFIFFRGNILLHQGVIDLPFKKKCIGGKGSQFELLGMAKILTQC